MTLFPFFPRMENRWDILGRSNSDLEKFYRDRYASLCRIIDLKGTSIIKIKGIARESERSRSFLRIEGKDELYPRNRFEKSHNVFKAEKRSNFTAIRKFISGCENANLSSRIEVFSPTFPSVPP